MPTTTLVRSSWPTVATLLTLALATLPANAQRIDVDITSTGIAATSIDEPLFNYPGDTLRTGQEGWVQLAFVVTPDGRAVDPIIIDSIGGYGFEREARDAVSRWRFAPSDTEYPDNIAEVRWELYRGKDAATSNFLRRYRRIVTDLHHEQFERARQQVDEALELGGWNLYESVMLWLMIGRVEGAEGSSAGKLESYRRALGSATNRTLGGDDKSELLRKIFELELERGHYAAARRTIDTLKQTPGGEDEVEALADRIRELERVMGEADTWVARATLYNACDCEQGQPLWTYQPARRNFSFANLDDGVERFEARCESGRLSGTTDAGQSWNLPEEWGACRIFVFGRDGASFDFRAHRVKDSDVVNGDVAMVRRNGLD